MLDPRITRACRFCGELEHLSIDTDGFERVAVRDGKVEELVWVKGHPVNAEYVDAVYCQVCETIAALDTWNGTRPAEHYALLRDFDPPVADAAVAA